MQLLFVIVAYLSLLVVGSRKIEPQKTLQAQVSYPCACSFNYFVTVSATNLFKITFKIEIITAAISAVPNPSMTNELPITP